jgi:hypothetical protein
LVATLKSFTSGLRKAKIPRAAMNSLGPEDRLAWTSASGCSDPGVEDAQGADHPGKVVDRVVGVLGHEAFGKGGTDLFADRLEVVLVELRAGGPGIADVTEQVDLVRLVED